MRTSASRLSLARPDSPFASKPPRPPSAPPPSPSSLHSTLLLSHTLPRQDVLGMRTSASRLPDGSWKLNGGKMWITNGAVSDTEARGGGGGGWGKG